MDSNATNTTGLIVQTILLMAQRVLLVSRDYSIAQVWDKSKTSYFIDAEKLIGKKITEIRNDSVFIKCTELIDQTFITGESNVLQYTTIVNDEAVTFHLRVLPNLEDERYVLLVVKILEKTKYPEIIEDKWKLALDAAGDGIWDLHLENGHIFFSPKWHEIFGYEPGEIIKMEDWTSKVHPEDLVVVEKKMVQYFKGETTSYSSEIRYLCKDGTYKWILSRGVIASKTNEGKPLRLIGTHQDIHERKLYETQYEANLNLLQKLIDSLPSGILVTDEYKKIVFNNEVFQKYHSANKYPSFAGLDGDSTVQLDKMLYKEPEKFISRIEQIAKQRELILNEELEMADGRIISRDYIPLSFTNDYKGEIWKFTDITLQKSIDTRFEKQRLFYEHILNNIPINISVTSADRRLLYANPNSIKDDALRTKAIGMSLEDFYILTNTPENTRQKWISQFDTAEKEKRKVEWIDAIEHEEGQKNYMLRYISPAFNPDGSLDVYIGYGINITDRVNAEEALKTSMAAFAHSFNYSGIGKALLAPGGKWLEVNDMICKLTGYTREELYSMHYRDITYPDDIDIDVPYIQQLLNKEIETYTIEKRYVSKNRQIIVSSLTVSLLWNTDDTPKYFICDILDITAQKMLTEELYRQNTELEATKTSLINKINQLEELSHMIAHNLRWPASNIKLLTERLMTDDNAVANIPQGFTKEEALSILHKSSIALNSSLNTLIDISEIKLNKKIAYDNCNFRSIIADITKQLQGIIFAKHAQLNLALEVHEVRYPKIYLESIFYNLLSNSLKYSSPQKPPQITITTKLDNGKVLLIVKDNGLGINLKKYGDKVFKLHKVFHEGFDSKGVGLFITKSQIESLGGKIEVKSKPKQGCEFIIML